MINNKFEYKNPILVGLDYGLNNNYDINEDKDIDMGVSMNVHITPLESENEAIVTLEVNLGKKTEDTPFYICAKESANFRWDVSMNEDIVKKLLNQNAPALLLSFLRPIITQITAASPFETYNIPFIDFTNNNKTQP